MEREQSVGWSTLALLLFFVGFGVACFGVAPLLSGGGSVREIVLAVVGSAVFVGSGMSYIPLCRREARRDARKAAQRRAATVGPLVPGSQLDVGHIWHMHAIRIVTPLLFWVIAIPILSPPSFGSLRWGWLALSLLVTYFAWTMEYAVAVSVAADGIVIRRLHGTRELKYCEILSANVVSSRGGMPSTLLISTSKDHMSPKYLIPLFDERLSGLIRERVPTVGGHA